MRLALALLLYAASAHAGAPVTTITASGLSFNPNSVSVLQGDTVRWTFSGCHNLTQDINSPAQPGGCEGAPFDYTFSSAGLYAYYCGIHGAGMSGVVYVTPVFANTSTATPSASPTPTFSHTPTPSPTPTDTPTATETHTPPPPGSTETSTPTVSATLTESPTLTVSATSSATATHSPTAVGTNTPPIQFRQVKAAFAPVPALVGMPVCLYLDGAPFSTSWSIYNVAGDRVARLSFNSGEPTQCWDTSSAVPGVYFMRMEAVMLDGSRRELKQKIAILKK